MITVHPRNRGIVEIIKPDINDGPWIAGGAALKWYQGLEVNDSSDIDVFCKNKKQALAVIEQFARSNYNTDIVHESDNAITLGILLSSESEDSLLKVQVIRRKFYNSVEDVIGDFDITVCQIATTGNEWVLGNTTAKDIRERNLRMQTPIRKGSAQRLLKYWAYGYRPVDGLLENMTDEEYFKPTHEGYGTL